MIITDSFVFLNFPKTGSTFVREALTELYGKKEKNSWWPWSRNRRHFEMYQAPNVRAISEKRRGQPNPHGTYWQIPERAQHLPVYCVFRDPVGRATSAYHYADWKKEEGLLGNIDTIKKQFPLFPELSLHDFMEYTNLYAPRDLFIGAIEYGAWASDFVHFFLRSPDRADRKVLEFADFEDLQNALGDVHFLDNSNLNQELADILLIHGFNENEVAFIRIRGKSNVSKTSKRTLASREEEIVTERIEDDAKLINRLAGITV